MSASFKMDDYVDVAQRIQDFYAKYPEGRLVSGSPPQVVEVGGKPYVWYHARAYRTPDDALPGDGWAAEPVPGPTQFTKDSELMNAETAAWGRAIVALGFATKKIASAQEVEARRAPPAAPPNGNGGVKATKAKVDEIETLIAALNLSGPLTEAQIRDGMLKAYGTEVTAELSREQAREFEARLSAKAKATA